MKTTITMTLLFIHSWFFFRSNNVQVYLWLFGSGDTIPLLDIITQGWPDISDHQLRHDRDTWSPARLLMSNETNLICLEGVLLQVSGCVLGNCAISLWITCCQTTQNRVRICNMRSKIHESIRAKKGLLYNDMSDVFLLPLLPREHIWTVLKCFN